MCFPQSRYPKRPRNLRRKALCLTFVRNEILPSTTMDVSLPPHSTTSTNSSAALTGFSTLLQNPETKQGRHGSKALGLAGSIRGLRKLRSFIWSYLDPGNMTIDPMSGPQASMIAPRLDLQSSGTTTPSCVYQGMPPPLKVKCYPALRPLRRRPMELYLH